MNNEVPDYMNEWEPTQKQKDLFNEYAITVLGYASVGQESFAAAIREAEQRGRIAGLMAIMEAVYRDRDKLLENR